MMLWTWRNWRSGTIKTLSNHQLIQDFGDKEGGFSQQTWEIELVDPVDKKGNGF